MEQQKPESQQLQKDPYYVLTNIYQSRMKQILQVQKIVLCEQDVQELHDQIKIRYLSFAMQNANILQVEQKENSHVSHRMQNVDTQKDKEKKQRKQRRFLEKVMFQEHEKRLILPNIHDVLFYQEQFMKKHQITLAKLRRILKEVTNMNLICSSYLDQILNEENWREKAVSSSIKMLKDYYNLQKEKIKQYFPNEYEEILNFSTMEESALVKQVKPRNNR